MWRCTLHKSKHTHTNPNSHITLILILILILISVQCGLVWMRLYHSLRHKYMLKWSWAS